jgi:elongation factor 1-beta
MAKVAVTYKLMPRGVEVDLDELEQRVRKIAEVRSVVREPIAFGLHALRVTVLVEDAAGESDRVERALAGLPDISNVQVVGLTRLLE